LQLPIIIDLKYPVYIAFFALKFKVLILIN
jgi:hypothetical protein